MKKKRIIFISVLLVILGLAVYLFFTEANPNSNFKVGQKLDSLNGVYVFYNGGVGNVEERNTSADGYNIGLKYQCVEFVKRYYYEYYKHERPDSYGNAKDFFNGSLADGQINKARDLLQFTNPSASKPNIGDLVIMDGHSGNPYGHVAIVSDVKESSIEIIQQNPGPFAPSRVEFDLDSTKGNWHIDHARLLGWLRKKNT